MPVDVLHDPLLRQRPHQIPASSAAGAAVPFPSISLDSTILKNNLQDLDLSQILRDALQDCNLRKRLGHDVGQLLDAPGGSSCLVPADTGDVVRSASAFNNAPLDTKIRFILNDILRIHHLATVAPPPSKSSKWEWKSYQSEIFASSSCVSNVAEIIIFLADDLDDVLPFNWLCLTLLKMPHGLWLLGRLLLAHSRRVSDVCEFLMLQCSGNDIDDPCSVFYGKVLLYISDLFPATALHIRHSAISQQKFFGLILSVTLLWQKKRKSVGSEDTIVDVLKQLLVSPKEDFRIWSSQNARLAGTANMASFEECRLQLLIEAYKLLPAATLELSDAQIVPVTSIMRLYIHLKECAELTLTTEEYRVLSKLATCRTASLSALSNQLVVLGLCCFTLLPDLLVDRTVECDFVEWIKWQLEVDVAALDAIVPEGGTYLEVLLLLASHLRVGQYRNIAEMLSDCLGLKVAVKSNSTVRMKNLLNNEVFRDEALLRHTLRVPPTYNLNASLVSALPVNCVYSLLQGKTVTSYDGLIKDWILAQLRKCSVPVHPVMVQVLALYAEKTLPFLKKNQDGLEEWMSLQKPFRPTEICAVIYGIPEPTKAGMKNLRTVDLFSRRDSGDAGCRQVHVSEILMAFYVLAYNSYYMNNLRAYLGAQTLNLQPYGMELINRIPFKYYLALTLRHQELYDPLSDILGRLMLEVLPHMRTVYDDMQTTFFEDENPGRLARMSVVPLATVPDSSCHSLSRYLDLLSRCPVDRLSTCMDDFLSLMPRLRNESLPPTTKDAFEKVWGLLAAVDSNTVFFSTTCAFLLTEDKSPVSVTSDELCFEPLHILRSDAQLFRKGFLTRILLRIFTSHLTASKLYLTHQLNIVEQQLMMKRNADNIDYVRDEQKRAMFMLQESLAVQILIEHCAPPLPVSDRVDGDFGLPSELTESQTAICAFIHRLILVNPTLAKLVIFQGFPLVAVPFIVRGCESLHICFDYLHEALDLPSIVKKLFVLELASCLCVKFRIPRTLVVARLCVEVIGTMLIAYPQTAVRPDIARVGAQCLARIGNVFPPLREECLAVLEQMLAVERSAAVTGRDWRRKPAGLLCAAVATSLSLQALVKRAINCVSGRPSLSSQND